MLRCRSLLLYNYDPLVVKPESPLRVPASIRRHRTCFLSIIVAGNGISEVQKPKPTAVTPSTFMIMHSVPLIDLGRRLRVQSSRPELGLLSLFFVLSTAVGAMIFLAIISIPTMSAVGAMIFLAIISIPTMSAIRRLAASMDKLSKVVSEEVPGTLSSLKLSGLEINDLTQQLINLRQRLSGSPYGKKDGNQ